MDNYLSHRWPQGPGVQPPPVPHPAALRRPVPVKRSRSPRRWLVPAVCIALCLALLGGISFWAVNGLAALLSSVEFRDPFGDPPRTSWQLPDQSDWSPEDLPWGEPDPSVSLAVGDPVYAEGNPLGYLTGTMTEGIVSALERESEVNSDGMGMIQTSAALNPGNSGGALVNGQGQVVGITSAKITGLMRERNESLEDAAVLENIGLALPITDILPFVNRILATGKSWRPSIGITCFEATADGRNGLQVKSVEKGVPAREAGLREGDLIVSANGRPVPTLTDLRRAIYRAGLDGEFHCIVVRDGAEVPVSFALVDKLEE